jgi:hydrogenase small subunit
MPGAAPNPTGVQPLSTILAGKTVINIPGCPINPDWLVGTVAYLIANGKAPPLDSYRRPQLFYSKTVHDRCPYREDFPEDGCQLERGCKGPITNCDCPSRKWNSGAANAAGVNWCIGAGRPYGSPCEGCTEQGFPDAMSPFSRVLKGVGDGDEGGEGDERDEGDEGDEDGSGSGRGSGSGDDRRGRRTPKRRSND